MPSRAPVAEARTLKNLPISPELHAVLKERARREGRLIGAMLAIALKKFLGPAFPKNCREASFLPENLK